MDAVALAQKVALNLFNHVRLKSLSYLLSNHSLTVHDPAGRRVRSTIAGWERQLGRFRRH